MLALAWSGVHSPLFVVFWTGSEDKDEEEIHEHFSELSKTAYFSAHVLHTSSRQVLKQPPSVCGRPELFSTQSGDTNVSCYY